MRAELCRMKSQLHLSAYKTASIPTKFKQHYTLEQFQWLRFVPMQSTTKKRLTSLQKKKILLVIYLSRYYRNLVVRNRASACFYSTSLTQLNKDRPTDVTCLIFCSTCFECQYIHLQELATVCGYTALVRCVLALRCGSAGVVWKESVCKNK